MPVKRLYEPIQIARQFLYVREIPENRGQRVEAIQRWCGGKPGDSWCAYFATMVLDICYQGACPLARTGSCDVILEKARKEGWIVTDLRPNDLYLRLRSPNDAHHVGFVTEVRVDQLGQISGNTSPAGSSNGDGVYEKPIKRSADLAFVRLPTV